MAKRVMSSILLACGIVFVFAGLSKAVGFTPIGILASVTAIAALLYAGGVWFGGQPAALAPAGGERVIVFDSALRVAAGASPGTPLLTLFPNPLRPEIEHRCRLALGGEHSHFEIDYAGGRIGFAAAPVPGLNGVVLYGALISGPGLRAPAPNAKPVPTVA